MSREPLPLPDPPIRTARLQLRPWRLDDAPALAAAWADPDVQRWTGVPDPRDAASAAAWIERNPALRHAGRSLDLVIDADGAVAGEVGVVVAEEGADRRGEVGWWLAPGHRGAGLASEAVRAFTAWLVDADGLHLAAVVARCAAANPRSGRVAAAAGFVLVGSSDGGATAIWRAGPPPRAGTLHP